MAHADLNFSDQVSLIQILVGVDDIDGKTSNANAVAMTELTGLSGSELWKLSTEQFLDQVAARIQSDPDFKAQILENIADNTDPAHAELLESFVAGTEITLTPATPVVEEEEAAEVVTEENNDSTFTPIPGPELQVLGTLPESVDPREIQALVTALGQDIGTIDGDIGSNTNAGIEALGLDPTLEPAELIAALRAQVQDSLTSDRLAEIVESGNTYSAQAVLRAMGVKDPQDGSDIGFDGQRGGETNRGLDVLAEHLKEHEYDATQHAASEENRRLAEEAAEAAIARAQEAEAARLAAEQAEAAQSLRDYFLDQASGNGEAAEAEPDLATQMMFDHLAELAEEPETPGVGPTIEAAEALEADRVVLESAILSQPGDMIGTAEILAAEADAEAARLEVEAAEAAVEAIEADGAGEALEDDDGAALDGPDSEAGVQFAGVQGAAQLFIVQDGVLATGHGAEFSALLTEHGSNGVEASLRDTIIKELGLDENFAFVQSDFDALWEQTEYWGSSNPDNIGEFAYNILKEIKDTHPGVADANAAASMTAAEFAVVETIEPDWVSDNVQPIYIDSDLGPSAGYEAYLRAIDENPELMGEKIRDAIEGLQGTYSEPRDWESYRDAVNAYYTNIIDVMGTDNAMGKTAAFEQKHINTAIDDVLGIEPQEPQPEIVANPGVS